MAFNGLMASTVSKPLMPFDPAFAHTIGEYGTDDRRPTWSATDSTAWTSNRPAIAFTLSRSATTPTWRRQRGQRAQGCALPRSGSGARSWSASKRASGAMS